VDLKNVVGVTKHCIDKEQICASLDGSGVWARMDRWKGKYLTPWLPSLLYVDVQVNGRASQVALVVENLTANAVDVRYLSLIPGLRRSPWRRAWHPSPVFLSGEPMVRGAW